MSEVLPTEYKVAAKYLLDHIGRKYWASSELPPEFNRHIVTGLKVRKIIKIVPKVRLESNRYKGKTWLLTDYGVMVAKKWVDKEGQPTRDTYIEYGVVVE